MWQFLAANFHTSHHLPRVPQTVEYSAATEASPLGKPEKRFYGVKGSLLSKLFCLITLTDTSASTSISRWSEVSTRICHTWNVTFFYPPSDHAKAEDKTRLPVLLPGDPCYWSKTQRGRAEGPSRSFTPIITYRYQPHVVLDGFQILQLLIYCKISRCPETLILSGY